MIRLHNTKTRAKEDFTPIDPNNVRMYVCGPTVYDRAHLGNGRPVVVFDVLFRLLRHVYGADHVTYVRNFTDVDDKINATALARQQAGAAGTLEDLIHQRTEETIQWYHDDMDALGALRPNFEPRATEYISQMIEMIETLIEKGFAYSKPISYGHNSRAVYFNSEQAPEHSFFRVEKDESYGQLSGRGLDEMISGAKAEVGEGKINPMDFVLWKPSKTDEPGWVSPWGYGRPGWHIECSAMSKALLGNVFDIHGGGIDLQFPHHENEIAQSCCANGTNEMARFWMHNEMLQVEGKKMSKSLGNFFTVRDLLEQGYPGEVIRFVYLSTHYSKPMDWTKEKAEQAEATLRKWRTFCYGVKADSVPPEKVVSHLSDDLNTSECIAWLHRYTSNGNASALLAGAQLLGLLTKETGSWFELGAQLLSDNQQLNAILAYRQDLRSKKEWAKADELRKTLIELGVVVVDSKNATAGYVEPNMLMRQLMSNVISAFQNDDGDMLSEAISRAESFGVVEPAPDRRPRAWTSREATRLLPKIEQALADICKTLDLVG